MPPPVRRPPGATLFPGDHVRVAPGAVSGTTHAVVKSVDRDGLITLRSGPRVHPVWLTKE